MTEIFFIHANTVGTMVVTTGTRATTADPWAMTTDLTLMDLTIDAVFVHLGGDDTTLYVVDAMGAIHKFQRTNATSTSPWMEMTPVVVALMVDAYAPTTQPRTRSSRRPRASCTRSAVGRVASPRASQRARRRS